MKFYSNFLQPLFFSKRFYWGFAALILLFVIAYLSTVVFIIAKILTLLFFLLIAVDYAALFSGRDSIVSERITPERMSNGDENPIRLELTNHYRFRTVVKVIDELPVQFQRRDFALWSTLQSGESKTLTYSVRPVARGEYIFHDLNTFAHTGLDLVIRRFKIKAEQTIKVYPSYLQLKKYDLLASSNHLADTGNRKIRKIGQSVEFEEIREYVNGDDIRRINWKATARKGGQLMMNNYTDERSQQVYCVIDKGRVMKMPFHGMSLLDYAINSSLILLRVALLRQDRAGLVTFGDNIGQILPADRKAGQMTQILETLYNQQTQFGETDFEKLYGIVRTRIPQRSLIVLYTNFESLSGLQRQLPFLRAIARTHLVLVVFFENTEVQKLSGQIANGIEDLYIRTIAEKFVNEKRQMVRELQQHGIFTILTAPENLTLATVNKYLDLKARQAI